MQVHNLLELSWPGNFHSQSTSHVTSISKNEMDIPIPLCNVRRFNGMLNICLEVFPEKDALTGKKIQNTWETIVIPEILNAVM